MKRSLSTLLFLLLLALTSNSYSEDYEPQVGDIYFQSLLPSALVIAIEGVTQSPYSHCGILNKKDGQWVIHEAIGPVRVIALETWIMQGMAQDYDVYRLKPEYQSKVGELLAATEQYMGRPYDIQYDFDDEKIYCSELIYKAFKTVYHEELGKVVTLGDLNWQPHEAFIRRIDPDLPLARKMITPKHLAEAPQLTQVFESLD